MEEKYYSVEKISDLLELHPKTIQRYIREGKIKAKKVGKAWRVSGHDLSTFVEFSDPSIIEKKSKMYKKTGEKIMVSSVADIDVMSMDEAMNIVNMLTATMNARRPEYRKATMNAQYIESELRVRVMLYGNVTFMESMMWYLTNYVNKKEN